MAVALFASACGGDAEAPGVGPSTAKGGTTFEVSLGDNLFEPGQFTVAPGDAVVFNLTNDGAAVHNKRVAGPDGQYDTVDDAVSEPCILAAGGAGVLEWVAPEERGTYLFRCDFHPTDMIGTIVVQ